MKKLLSLIVVLALVAWGTYKGAVWWLADQTLTDIRRSVSDHGALERGSIGSSIGGDLTLTDSRFQPFRLTQPLIIRRLQYQAGSPQALVESVYGNHDLPGSWRLNVVDWSLALDAAMLRNWVTAGEEDGGPLFAPVCGPDARQHLGSGDLIRMGIDRLTGDAMVRQSASGLKLEAFSQQAGSIEVDWQGARLRLDNGEVALNPGPQQVRLVLRDGGLMRRVTAYCARETSVPPMAWADLVMTSLGEALLVRGYHASPQLLAVYRQWLTEGGELEIMLDPTSPLLGIPVREIADDPGEGDAVDESSMAVTYNGAEVPDVYLTRVSPERPVLPEQAMEPLVPDGTREPIIAGWRPVPLDESAQWLGYTVRVTLSSGRVVEGRLTRVDDREVEVARPVDGGEVAYPMVLRAVDRFEIWRRGQGTSGR